AGSMTSIPFDFFLRVTGKTNGRLDTFSAFPVLKNKIQTSAITIRALLLNCLTNNYATLWANEFNSCFISDKWSKEDKRLKNIFNILKKKWSPEFALKNDYERRQALVEIDVLVAMAIGM